MSPPGHLCYGGECGQQVGVTTTTAAKHHLPSVQLGHLLHALPVGSLGHVLLYVLLVVVPLAVLVTGVFIGRLRKGPARLGRR